MIKAATFALLLAGPAFAVDCYDLDFEQTSFTVCEVDPAAEDLRLFHRAEDGTILGYFSAVETLEGAALSFAMNAGMYHPNRDAVGLYRQDGVETQGVISSSGPGNFGLLPNGILCLNDDRAQVFETLSYVAQAPACRDATQSGPMLVIDGALHPRFIPGGTSRYIRNGVGVREDGIAVFAISNEPVSFDRFGRLFRDTLETPNALFLDGKVSRLYAPQIDRNDFGFMSMGPMVGVLEPAEP